MKKWELEQKVKRDQQRVKNAKASVTSSSSVRKSLNDSKQFNTMKSPVVNGQSNAAPSGGLNATGTISNNEQYGYSSISDYYESEKANLQSIPLYRILKLQNLQTYAKELISRGYGYDLKKFNDLSPSQIDSLLNEIKVLPGHKTKLIDLLDLISNEMIPQIENDSLWNMRTPESSGSIHQPSTGKSLTKGNSVKLFSVKSQPNIKHAALQQQQQYTRAGGFMSNPRDNSNNQANKSSNQLSRKNSQPPSTAGTNSRQNNHAGNTSNSNPGHRQTKSQTGQHRRQQQQQQNQPHGAAATLSNQLSYDYFADAGDEGDGYDEFQDAIQSLVKQYNLAKNPDAFRGGRKEISQDATDESMQQDIHDLEMELDANIGFKNTNAMRAKFEKVLNVASRQSGSSTTAKGASFGNISGSTVNASRTTTTTTSASTKNSNYQGILQSSLQATSSAPAQTAPSKIVFPNIGTVPGQTGVATLGTQKRPSSGVSRVSVQPQKKVTIEVNEDDKLTNSIKTSQQQKSKDPVQQQSKLIAIPSSSNADKALGVVPGKTLMEDRIQKDEIARLKLKRQQEQTAIKEKEQQSAVSSATSNTKEKNTFITNTENTAIVKQPSAVVVAVGSNVGSNAATAGISQSAVKKIRPQTAKYTREKQIMDDGVLIPEYDENDNLVLHFKESKLIKNLRSKITSKITGATDDLNPQLDYESIKHMYMSIEGGQLTSTIVNLDIEEMCFCFACAVIKHIERGGEAGGEVKENISKLPGQLHAIKELHDEENYQTLKSQGDNYFTFKNSTKEQTTTEKNPQKRLEAQEDFSQKDPMFPSQVTTSAMMQQQQHPGNDISLNRTTNLVEEPTMIQYDYNPSIINADAEKYLKFDEGDDLHERQPPQGSVMSVLKGGQDYEIKQEYAWKQKKSLSDISERTHEISRQKQSLTIDQTNNSLQSQNMLPNITRESDNNNINLHENEANLSLSEQSNGGLKGNNADSKRQQQSQQQQQQLLARSKNSASVSSSSHKQFESSRPEIEEILKESLLMKVRDNASLARRLDLDHKDHGGDLEYTDEEDDNHGEEADGQSRKKLTARKSNPSERDFDEDYNLGISDYPKDALTSHGGGDNNNLQEYQNNNGGDDDEHDGYSEFEDDIETNRKDNDDAMQANSELVDQGGHKSLNDLNGDDAQEVESEGEVERQDDENDDDLQNQSNGNNNIGNSSMNFSTISRYSIVIPNDDAQNKRLFDKTFNYKESSDAIYTQTPSKETVQNYCKNVCLSCQLEKQIPIIALVYIERLVQNSKQPLSSKNWRKIVLTAMIMGSKIWDDESFENKNFSQAFPQFDVIQINEMERVFLNFIDYNLYVKAAEYAKYYFILREFAQKNRKSFPLRPLDLKTILYLQNNANRAQSNLREMYSNPLNKSF